MLKIRLSRRGKKSQPSYRVVVQEHTAPIKGKFVEELGHYLPSAEPKVFQVDHDRVKHWISVGAQPSDTVASLLKKDGMDGMDQYLAPRDKQRKKKNPDPEEEAPAPEASAEGGDAAPAEGGDAAPAPEAKAEEAPAASEEAAE